MEWTTMAIFSRFIPCATNVMNRHQKQVCTSSQTKPCHVQVTTATNLSVHLSRTNKYLTSRRIQSTTVNGNDSQEKLERRGQVRNRRQSRRLQVPDLPLSKIKHSTPKLFKSSSGHNFVPPPNTQGPTRPSQAFVP